MKVYLIRHGMTPGKLLHQYIGGKTDQPLSEEGRAVLSELRDSGIYPETDRVYVSPMLRCAQTAEILFPKAAQTVVQGLKEMDFGVFEGRSAADMEEDEQYQAWVATMCEAPIPGGEIKEDFTERCCRAFAEVIGQHDFGEEATEKPAVFAIHGGTIMALLSRFGRPEKGYYDWYVKNGHGYICEWDGSVLQVEEQF